MPSPRKLLVQVSLGLCLVGSWEHSDDLTPHLFHCTACGLLLFGNLWLGSTFPWPSLSEIPRCSAACPGETHPDLGVWAKPLELSGTEIPGGAGCGALQDVSTITEPMQTALSTDWSLPHTLLHPCCRDSLFLRLSPVSARQKECLTLPAQHSAGNKTQSTFWSGIGSWDH